MAFKASQNTQEGSSLRKDEKEEPEKKEEAKNEVNLLARKVLRMIKRRDQTRRNFPNKSGKSKI